MDTQEINKRPGKSAALAAQEDPDKAAKRLMHNMGIYALPKVNILDVGEIEARIALYFSMCAEDGVKPGVAGLALALGVDRTTLRRWAVGAFRESTHRGAVKRAYDLLDAQIEGSMLDGSINPIVGIFLMKNNHDYADKHEVVAVPNNPLGELRSQEEIEQRYIDMVPDE